MQKNLKIYFVTSNDRKVGEAKLGCEPYGIEVIKKPVDIEEIQSHIPKDVSINKAKQAFAQLQKPLVVTDTFWSIPTLKGFPGPYMKDIANWFTEDDFIALLKDKTDRTVIFSENITYIDKNEIRSFSKEFKGSFAHQPRGVGNSIENVAEFDGVTLGERREQGGFSHSADDYVWVDFAKWYKNKQK